LLDGNRGLISNLKKQEIYKELKLKENDLKLKIIDLEKKNSLLTDNLDLDYIEILIREKFLFGKTGETTYIIENDNKQN
jgi:cell division protein FtsB